MRVSWGHCTAAASGPQPGNPLMDTVLGEFRTLNARRNATIAGLGVSRTQWAARQAETTEHLAELFAPLERNATAPDFEVTGSIHHASGFTMHKILYQTRPGLYVTGSLWVPDGLQSDGSILLRIDWKEDVRKWHPGQDCQLVGELPHQEIICLSEVTSAPGHILTPQ